ncbi:MAG TPA: glycosyltransferase family 39 protein, partial [Anaerolineae bacterium]|nr:glycosyltransferase family 39 protein [Anaerolineae bacterium]
MAPLRNRQPELLSLASSPRLLASSFPRTLIYLAIFIAAFLPRLATLDAYVAPDEGKWIYRSAHFLQALLRGELAQMTSFAATPEVEVLAPAVPTMWTGALGLTAKYWLNDTSQSATLADYLSSIPAATEKIPLDVYPWTRFPTVLLTSLAILAFYFLLSQLIGPGAALLAALLLALDPFFIGLSRVIHHDALVAIFIMASLLTLLLYRKEAKAKAEAEQINLSFSLSLSLKSPSIWLIISAVAGGLALLTKPTALYLVVFVVLFLWLENGRPYRRTDWRRAAIESCIWGFIALATCVVFWPA